MFLRISDEAEFELTRTVPLSKFPISVMVFVLKLLILNKFDFQGLLRFIRFLGCTLRLSQTLKVQVRLKRFNSLTAETTHGAWTGTW